METCFEDTSRFRSWESMSINTKILPAVLSVFSVLIAVRDSMAARRYGRGGTLNLARSKTVPLNFNNIGTNDPCPTDVPGFDGSRCHMCINNLTAKNNTDIKDGSIIKPITEAMSGGNVYELCGRYISWPGCFNVSLNSVCAGKIAPDCAEDDPLNGYCTACINSANSAKRWWERPAWWFKNSIYAKSATNCDGMSPTPPPPPPPPPGTCSFSVIDVSAFTSSEQNDLFNNLRVGVPGAVGLTEPSFFSKTNWTIADLKVIKSNISNLSDSAKSSYESKRQDLELAKTRLTEQQGRKTGAENLRSSADKVNSASTFAVTGAALSAVSATIAMGQSIGVAVQSNKIKKKTYLMNNLINSGDNRDNSTK